MASPCDEMEMVPAAAVYSRTDHKLRDSCWAEAGAVVYYEEEYNAESHARTEAVHPLHNANNCIAVFIGPLFMVMHKIRTRCESSGFEGNRSTFSSPDEASSLSFHAEVGLQESEFFFCSLRSTQIAFFR